VEKRLGVDVWIVVGGSATIIQEWLLIGGVGLRGFLIVRSAMTNIIPEAGQLQIIIR
jgi:hypothetical protein